MYALYRFLIKSNQFNTISFYTNNNPLAKEMLGDDKVPFVELLEKEYKTCLLDIPLDDEKLIHELSKKTDKIIAFDYFNYGNNKIETLINLINHNINTIDSFLGTVYEGVEFTILKDEILQQKRMPISEKKKVNILITFGGEDPTSNTIKVLNILKSIKGLNISVILGILNKDVEEIKREFKNITLVMPTNKIGDYINKSDIVFCGGGTTLIESIHIGNPIVALGQNEFENNFIAQLKSKLKIYDCADIMYLLEKVKESIFREDIYKSYRHFIDGNGKNRIKDIILGINKR